MREAGKFPAGPFAISYTFFPQSRFIVCLLEGQRTRVQPKNTEALFMLAADGSLLGRDPEDPGSGGSPCLESNQTPVKGLQNGHLRKLGLYYEVFNALFVINNTLHYNNSFAQMNSVYCTVNIYFYTCLPLIKLNVTFWTLKSAFACNVCVDPAWCSSGFSGTWTPLKPVFEHVAESAALITAGRLRP